MSIEKKNLSDVKSQDILRSLNCISNSNLILKDSNKKYINLLTKKININIVQNKKTEVYMNYLHQNILQWIF
jgi:hypothetical protein